MIYFADRIRLFNWVKARAEMAKQAAKNLSDESSPTMEHFAEELQAQGKAIALLELGMAILDPGWSDQLSAYSDQLTEFVNEQ